MNIFRRRKTDSAPVIQEPPRTDYQVIIVGAGHNGLICGAYLAVAGVDVLLLEARDTCGGPLTNTLIADEFSCPLGAHALTGLHARIVRDLKLQKFGLTFVKKNMNLIALDGEGHSLRVGGSTLGSHESEHAVSEYDAKAYPAFMDKLNRYAAALGSLIEGAPPQMRAGDFSDLKDWLKDILNLPEVDLQDLLRWSVSSVGDILDDQFESDLLKAGLAFDGLQGGAQGPRSMGTMSALLWHWAQRRLAKEPMSVPRGGPGQLAEALALAAEAKGATIQTGVACRLGDHGGPPRLWCDA